MINVEVILPGDAEVSDVVYVQPRGVHVQIPNNIVAASPLGMKVIEHAVPAAVYEEEEEEAEDKELILIRQIGTLCLLYSLFNAVASEKTCSDRISILLGYAPGERLPGSYVTDGHKGMLFNLLRFLRFMFNSKPQHLKCIERSSENQSLLEELEQLASAVFDPYTNIAKNKRKMRKVAKEINSNRNFDDSNNLYLNCIDRTISCSAVWDKLLPNGIMAKEIHHWLKYLQEKEFIQSFVWRNICIANKSAAASAAGLLARMISGHFDRESEQSFVVVGYAPSSLALQEVRKTLRSWLEKGRVKDKTKKKFKSQLEVLVEWLKDLYETNRYSKGVLKNEVSSHAVCIRTSDRGKTVTLLDPGKKVIKTLTPGNVFSEFLPSLIDVFVIRKTSVVF